MEEKTVMDALVQMKRTGNLLNEMEDLTQQLAQAIDRNDQVSMQMLIAMREEPLGKLQAADLAVRDQIASLDEKTGRQLAAMLNGGPPAQEGERMQTMLCDQVAANRRRLSRILELDRRLNQRMAREKSAYQSKGQ